MRKFLVRRLFVALLLIAISSEVTQAQECKGNPNALGTSRTLAVKPADFPLVGKTQYLETIRLKDREVVLTFDDGPMEDHTEAVLDALKRECVRATFFMLGVNAAEYPKLARRVYDEGHTVGHHTFSHPDVETMPFDKAKSDIKLGVAAVRDALGPNRRAAPFYRPPYLSMTRELERHLNSQGMMVWSIDADSEDWAGGTEDAIIQRTLERLEKVGKGILLMHDIQPITAKMLPRLLGELKAREFRIVHVVPSDVSERVRQSKIDD